MTSFASWKDKVAFWGITAFISAGAIWAYRTDERVDDRPTTEQVRQMIQSEAPYAQDKRMIEAELLQSKKLFEQVAKSIDKNTDAINALRIHLAEVKRGDK